MPSPTKPFTVLKVEKRSHRTKAELAQREQGEAALSTGVALKERHEVKNNIHAHSEFLRLNELLIKIEKNDAIYENIINRYCSMYAECVELGERRDYFYKLVKELQETFKVIAKELDPQYKADTLIEFTNQIAKLTTGMMNIDKILQTKRKMLFDIEKENIMTIAAALRSIPKKEDKSSNKLLEALNGG